MKVENATYPISEQISALQNNSSTKPIVMLNLLKFSAKAKYADGRTTDLTGAQAYALYADKMQKFVEQHGGKFLFVGDIASLVVGVVEDLWDIAALVEYPSAAAFAKTVTLPEVAEIGVHRAAGLDGQLLICVSQR
jgi:uncharacterized protein (DUF1330 family)